MIAEVKANPQEFSSERIVQALLLAAEKLPPRQVAFVDNYVANGFNGSQAYKSAGYRTKTDAVARSNAAKIIAKHSVSNYLYWKLRQVMAENDAQIDEGRLIRESNAIAYASLTDVLSWDAEGRVTVKASSEIPREVAAAIKKIRSTTRTIPQEDGPPIEETKVEIELHDKKGALDLQARIAGMLRETKVADYSNYTLNMFMDSQPPARKEKVIKPSVAG
jgi:hypothetical protein